MPFSSGPPTDSGWQFDDTEGIPVGLPDLLTPRPAQPRDDSELPPPDSLYPEASADIERLRLALAAAEQRAWLFGAVGAALGAAVAAGLISLL